MKLSAILDGVVASNDTTSWKRLLYFASRCLRVPKHGGRRWSLTTQFNRQLNDECDEPTRFKPPKMVKDNTDLLEDRVSAKLEEGDFRGAVRLTCSDDTFADPDATTIAALRSKHPAAHPKTTLPSPPDHDDLEGVLSVNECDIRQAIRSFPKGSAGGPDCLRPQHLLDLTSSTAGPGGVSLLRSLTAFTNLVLSGNTPVIVVRPFLFGASLVALKKRDGGLRPIAVGCTFRRLAAKC